MQWWLHISNRCTPTYGAESLRYQWVVIINDWMFNRTVAMCGIAVHCKHFELLKSERIELMSSRGEVAITAPL